MSDNDGKTPLHLAAESKQEEIVVFLLERRAIINVIDSDGWSPLHWACQRFILDYFYHLFYHLFY